MVYTFIESGPDAGSILLCGATETHDYGPIYVKWRPTVALLMRCPYEGLEDTPGEALPALDYKPVFFFGERCIEPP